MESLEQQTLEQALAATETDAAATLRAAGAVMAPLRRFRTAAQMGDLHEIRSSMEAAESAMATLRQQMASAREVESRRLEVSRGRIEDEKEQQIEEARTKKLTAENSIRSWYRSLALLLTPIPGILFGFVTYFLRMGRERETSGASQRVGGGS